MTDKRLHLRAPEEGRAMSYFTGLEQHSASELRRRIAEWEPPEDLTGVANDLTGAIMNLCDAVEILQGRVRDLEEADDEHDYA